MKKIITTNELVDASNQQVFTLSQKINSGECAVEEIGDYLPGNLLVTDLSLNAVTYMNRRGCDILMHSLDELQTMGPDYFQRFFVREESEAIVSGYVSLQQQQDPSRVFSFTHRVKPNGASTYNWYFGTAKLLYTPGEENSHKILLMVNDVNSLGAIAQKINNMLEESDWVKKNFKRFSLLTKKEKDIITLLASGLSTKQIAETLCISRLTVNTHRRNITKKLELKSFALLYRFAVAFGLIKH